MPQVFIEDAEYVVRITLTTTMRFAPIERERSITKFDAIENALGTMPDGFWDDLEGEGWNIESDAERVEPKKKFDRRA